VGGGDAVGGGVGDLVAGAVGQSSQRCRLGTVAPTLPVLGSGLSYDLVAIDAFWMAM
jgi:hypothetical protein